MAFVICESMSGKSGARFSSGFGVASSSSAEMVGGSVRGGVGRQAADCMAVPRPVCRVDMGDELGGLWGLSIVISSMSLMSITCSADRADAFDFRFPEALSALGFLGSFALGSAFFRCFGLFPVSPSSSPAFCLAGLAGVADLSLSLGIFFFGTFGGGLVAR